MDIKEITAAGQNPGWVIAELKRKSVAVPAWAKLDEAYDVKKHPVMNKQLYPDKVTKKGIEKVTRITLGLPKLAVKRMTELMFAIPVQRIYKSENNDEKLVGEIMEAIFTKNRVDAMNIERGRYLFASCEAMTLWYTQEQDTIYAGEQSRLKLRSKSYSPMNGDALYPLLRNDYRISVASSKKVPPGGNIASLPFSGLSQSLTAQNR